MSELIPVEPQFDERTRKEVVKRLGTKSLRQISDEIGVSPDVVLAIKQDIVNSMDALTIQEHVAKAFVTLQEIVNKALLEFDINDDPRSKAPLLASATQATKTTLQMLKDWETKNQGQVESLNAKRRAELVRLVSTSVDKSVDEISEVYDIPRQDLFDIFNANLLETATEMEARHESG